MEVDLESRRNLGRERCPLPLALPLRSRCERTSLCPPVCASSVTSHLFTCCTHILSSQVQVPPPAPTGPWSRKGQRAEAPETPAHASPRSRDTHSGNEQGTGNQKGEDVEDEKGLDWRDEGVICSWEQSGPEERWGGGRAGWCSRARL